MRFFKVLLIVLSLYVVIVLAMHFPQKLVDAICFEKATNRALLLDAVNNYRCNISSLLEPRQFTIPTSFAFSDLVIGPDADTLLIDTNYVHNGNVYVIGAGVMIIDNSYFSVAGQIGLTGNGKMYVQNGATLHFNQSWVGQYSLWMFDSSYFEADDATIDANGVMHFIELHDDATYIARRCYYPDWTFKKFFERSTVIMEDVSHIGDMMVGDSCNIHLIRCDTLMPWFQAPNGSVIDIEFPDPDFVEHFEFHDGIDGIEGLGETFVLDSCAQCWWSLETYPGCSVIVRNSEIRGCAQRIPGSDTFSIYGIRNYNYNTDFLVPLHDRHLEFISTYNYWWNWYPWENTVFFIDSCVFGEMIPWNTATVFATRCVHDGSTICLVTKDSSFMSFEAGTSYAYVGSFQQSTFLLKDTRIIPMWHYQTTNIAHDNSIMLCVNCNFDSLPFALDTALVMWVAIENPESGNTNSEIPIVGSAWISTGAANTTTFTNYHLYWSYAGEETWTSINESSVEAHSDTIGIFNTTGLSEGNYTLRLTEWISSGDSLTALKNISITTAKIDDETSKLQNFSMTAYPNPFNSSVKITVPTGTENLEIHDLRWNVIMTHHLVPLPKETKMESYSSSGKSYLALSGRLKDFVWHPDKSIPSGIYFAIAKMDNGQTITQKIIYLK